MYKFSKYLVITDINEDEKLLFSTKTAEMLHISQTIFDLLKAEKYNLINEKVLTKLFMSEIIVDKNEDEFNNIIDYFKKKSKEKSKILNYTIQPTADCQLGCHYCGQVHEKITMDSTLSKKVFDYITNELTKNEYTGLFVTWYGAEPLLGIKGIRELSKNLIDLTNSLEIEYKAMMITNGLALKENIFFDLVNLNVFNYQITLDGDEESHNNSRYTKKQGKTFNPIFNNIVSAVKNPIYEEKKCNILIRSNVHKDNYKSIDNLIDLIHETGIADKVSLDFAPVHDWGKNYAKDNIGLTPDLFGELEIEWFMKMKEYGFRFVKEILPEKKNGTCMVTSEDSELIDAKGRLSYCWETPYTPEFDFEGSTFFHGNIDSPNNKIDRSKLPMGNWYDDIESENHGTTCKKCNFLPVCGGGCPVHWYKEMAMCPSFKYNFNERMLFQYINSQENEN